MYVIPQYIWLVLLYYLTSNSIIKFLKHDEEFSQILKKTPEAILSYNNIIMRYIDMWVSLVLVFAIILLFSGIIISFIRFLPYIGSFSMASHGIYGYYLGVWLLIIIYTYKSYIFFGSFFFLLIPAILGILELGKTLKDKKLGRYYNFK